ncbi:MAG: MATE family efflux transporter [Alphaproteobacteria bacterium]|nr:MATE family efflux transporter [Alphaproteobacteria bacterium]
MSAPASGLRDHLVTAPLLPTLLKMSLPNMIAMLATASVAIIETAYVGVLGTDALAGMALVFPMIMLQQMLSAGAMGGGVSSAISRALGAGDPARARALAVHATVIGAGAGTFFAVLFLSFGAGIYALMGGRGGALGEALAYSNVVFLGAPTLWLTNTLASVIRGLGNMKVPSATYFAAAALQIIIGGSLGLGLGPFPRLGMSGVAMGQAIAFLLAATFFYLVLRSGRLSLRLEFRGVVLNREMFWDILKVGAVACLSPLQTILTMLILTRLVAQFGTEALAGFGIGARLEFLLIPIAFAIGVACVPLVGMAIGAGDVARARRAAWTGAWLSGGLVGAFGVAVAVGPTGWTRLFSEDPAVLAATFTYLVWAGPCFGFLAVGLCLYFASQGSGKVLGPVLAGTFRLGLILLGGIALVALDAPAWTVFALIGAGMAVYGVASVVALLITPWGRASPKPAA